MEIFLLLIVIIMVFWVGTRVTDKTTLLHYRIDALLNELQQLRKDIDTLRSPANISPKSEEYSAIQGEKIPAPIITPIEEVQQKFLLIITPPVNVSTSDAFARLN